MQHFTYLTFFILGLFMTAITHAATATANPSKTDNSVVANIIKSTNDKRNYGYKKLENGLKLLVISDKEAQRAAAAVDVGVGSGSDPDEFLGLAHFLEHMLFLGTDKYPDPDDYINYISEHGGNHNAFTAFDHTNYFFDIDPKYLHEGLKRFSRFFVAPLMLEKYVERERNAVDSEFQSKLREDAWREMSAFKAVVNPKHPYSRFTVGNLETLPNETVRPALLDFYQKHYSADRMSAIIIGREEIGTLLKWGETLFADIPNRDTEKTDIAETLFDDVTLPIVIQNQSIKNEKNLSLYFRFPYQLDNEYSKSLGYLSYILGYEGQGSLLEGLKQLGYASELYAGSGYRIGNENSFEIGIQLTDKGYENTDEVLAVVFAYIDLFNHEADEASEARYQEVATVAKTAFQFREKRNAIHEVSGLATRLNRFPIRDIQSLSAIFSGYNRAQISAYLKLMTPKSAVVQITAPEVTEAMKQKTSYFDVPYMTEVLDIKAITYLGDKAESIVKAMHLPETNPFIADDYALQRDKISEKHEILQSGIELFYKNDTTFNVPRASVQISLQPTADLSIEEKTTMFLLALLLDEQLTTTLYDASIAGVNAEIVAGEKSIALSLEGYQQKMPELLTVILQQLKTLKIDTPTFTRVKETYRQDLQNTASKMPYQQTFAYLNKLLVTDASLPAQRLAVLEGIDEKQLKAFADKRLSALAVRMMVYGNATYDQAKSLAESLSQTLKGTQFNNTWQPNSAKTLTKSAEQSFSVNHDDNAITYYIQAGSGYQARAEIGLLAKMLEPQFFTQLRTEKQLGYIVFAYPRPTYEQAGIAFTVQSPVATVSELEAYITDFNSAFAKSLSELSTDDLTAVKNVLKDELLQKPENLISAAGLYWSDILTTGKTASSRQAIADAIDGVALPEFVANMQNILTNGKYAAIKAKPQKE